MDKEILVRLIQDLVRDYSQRNQTFNLVMLIPTIPYAIDSRYTLLVSAHWLDDKSPKEAVNLILADLLKKIGAADYPEYRKIARVTVVRTDDPFVNAITSAFNVTQSDITLNDCNINGVIIEHAIILESHRPIPTPTPKGSGPKPPPKVGRNDPCPCGSGRKHKKCCGK